MTDHTAQTNESAQGAGTVHEYLDAWRDVPPRTPGSPGNGYLSAFRRRAIDSRVLAVDRVEDNRGRYLKEEKKTNEQTSVIARHVKSRSKQRR